jgi:hypothetical protein
MSLIAVDASNVDGGWLARVTVTDHDGSSDFEVEVTAEELHHFAPGATNPDDLVRRSFEFLLAREPKESIMSSFGLAAIGRYFPEYERDIRRRR